MISPFKAVIGDAYKAVELRLLAAIRGVSACPPSSAGARRLVKRADRIAAFLEATRLAGFSREEATRILRPPGSPAGPDIDGARRAVADRAEAKTRYLARVKALG